MSKVNEEENAPQLLHRICELDLLVELVLDDVIGTFTSKWCHFEMGKK